MYKIVKWWGGSGRLVRMLSSMFVFRISIILMIIDPARTHSIAGCFDRRRSCSTNRCSCEYDSKQSPSGKKTSIPDYCTCSFEAPFRFDRVSIVMCDFISVRFTKLCSGYVAQAAHWFDYKKMWPETAMIPRKGGTAVFWVRPHLPRFELTRPHSSHTYISQIYSEFRMTSHLSLDRFITAHAQGKTLLHPWDPAGNNLVEVHLITIY